MFNQVVNCQCYVPYVSFNCFTSHRQRIFIVRSSVNVGQ